MHKVVASCECVTYLTCIGYPDESRIVFATTPDAGVPATKGRYAETSWDDIFDTGHTMVGLLGSMKRFRPKSISTAVLLRKEGRCEVDFTPEFVAFNIPDEFVVGYGLDYRDQFRNLPYVAGLEPDDLEQ